MRVALVVAVADNGVIGKDNALLWRLPDDLKHFKALTMGKPIIMGRKTYQSIGRPLPGRRNIVISRNAGLTIDGCTVCASLDAALALVADAEEVCVIGGGEIYAQALTRATIVHLTRVHAAMQGDTFFPALSDEWREVGREDHAADERHAFPFTFFILERKS